MVACFNMPGIEYTVFYCRCIYTCVFFGKRNIFGIFFVFMEIECYILTVDIGNICQFTIKISIDSCLINGLCSIVNISISIFVCFCSCTVSILILAANFNGVFSIGSEICEDNCAVILLSTLYTADKVFATVIEIVNKSERSSCCGGSRFLKHKYSCISSTGFIVMELTVTFFNGKRNHRITVMIDCIACSFTCDIVVAVSSVFFESDIITAAYY